MSNMIDLPDSSSYADEWYTKNGADQDVVLSTRVRLARNLADFPFPGKFRNDDAVRVQTLVFDAFLKSEDSDSYRTIAIAGLNPLGSKMLLERGLIKQTTLNSPGAGIVMRINGNHANSGLVCTINDCDHVRISCFVPGLDCDFGFKACHEMDETLQKGLQFAASYDFGYLTSNIQDSGSGMKISARVHLPSTAFLGQIGPLFESLPAKGLVAEPAFGVSVNAGASVGSFYQISSMFSGNGSEVEQLAGFSAVLKSIVETERKNTDYIWQKRATEATDRVLKSFAVSKFAMLMDLRESIPVISDIKWGKNLGLIAGIEDADITALLYRIQEAHLRSVIQQGNLKFPMDINEDDKLKSSRLRSLIIHDTFEHISNSV